MALVMAPEVGPPELAQPITVLLPLILLWWPGSSLVPHFPAPHNMVFTSVDLIKTSPVPCLDW